MMKIFRLGICMLLTMPLLSQTNSTIQEQSNFYKQFHFTSDQHWDSLNQALNGQPATTTQAQRTNTTSCSLVKKVYGWHPYWNGSVYNNYDWSMLSDFCYFDYEVTPSTGQNSNASFAWSTSAAVTAALSHSVNVQFCASLFSSHSTFWASSTAQQTFITNAINLLNSRGGNGVNIDFEGMGSSDKTPFKNFMVNLCNQVHAANPNYKVSIALYAVDWSTSFDIPGLNPYVDNFIIMGYDYYYSGSAQAGPEAPLYNFQTGYNYTLSKSITYYLKQGVTPSKLLLGLPWYGREWETVAGTAPSNTTGGFTSSRTYAYVKNNPTTYSAANKNWEGNSFNPYYSYQSSGNWRQCWIDDVYSLGRKFDMVNQRGLGGIGIWALGYDDGYSDFWNLIRDKFSNCATVACTDSIYDMGGPTRNYYDNESYVYTIAPTGASKVRLTFSSMDLESGYDSLYLYDGSGTAAPVLGAYSGTVNPGIVNSTGPAITVKFKSDGATNKTGYKAIWNCIQDNTSPTTQVSAPPGWQTQNFTVSYTDADNTGGVGIEKSFYQVSDYNGAEWRANGTRGFFNDDFNTASVNADWASPAASGTWSISSNALLQSDESNANTNLYAVVTQSLSNRYLYSFKATISGAGTNRRGGIHIFCDAPTQSNRGNNYLIWMRPDQGTIELYKNTSNVLSVVKTVTFTINANVSYDYKITMDRISGEMKLWINNAFVTSWTDTSPFASGSAVSFRSGNCKLTIDDFKVFRSRAASTLVSVGSSTADVRYENTSPSQPSANISSMTKDNADNLSSINSQLVNVDWTKPGAPPLVKDGVAADLDTTYVGTQLVGNYTAAKDTNSGVAVYYYAIGTTPGSQNIAAWTANGSALAATQTGLSLVNGQKYYFMVKARNGAGLVGDSTVSDGILYLSSIPTGIENLFNDSRVSLYPNPVTEQLTIAIISDKAYAMNYSVMDAAGKCVMQEQSTHIDNGVNTLQISLADHPLAKGVYFLQMQVEGKQIIKKFIVN
ncbi:MAG: T9SS type A sorting domain-containing protein [Bacteroidetes bacterium]|nr:T9SS type A sorting domain-containing protein [Bacteroidota bacterium]